MYACSEHNAVIVASVPFSLPMLRMSQPEPAPDAYISHNEAGGLDRRLGRVGDTVHTATLGIWLTDSASPFPPLLSLFSLTTSLSFSPLSPSCFLLFIFSLCVSVVCACMCVFVLPRLCFTLGFGKFLCSVAISNEDSWRSLIELPLL